MLPAAHSADVTAAPVTTAFRGHLAIVTLNRPEALNAINAALATALGEALEEAARNEQVRAIVVTGSGRAFSAGMDLKAFARGEKAEHPLHPEWGFGGFARHPVDVPVIAAVNGIAVGGGAELALACDLVIASEEARFGFPEVTRGLVAAAGGVFRLPRLVPRRVALELLLTGEIISAHRAVELGLANDVVPQESLLEVACALGERIAANAPLAVQATKRFVHEEQRYGSAWDQRIWDAHDETVMPVFDSRDAAEGARAFAEKRTPEWAGR